MKQSLICDQFLQPYNSDLVVSW